MKTLESTSKENDGSVGYPFILCRQYGMQPALSLVITQYNNISQGKPDTDPKDYVDIKSKELRDILRRALVDANDISFTEDKLTVREVCLRFYYIVPLMSALGRS
jgi:hypothetical protein